MTETLPRLLLRLSEAGDPAILWGRQAAPHAGRDFERLLTHGILIEQAPATDWDVCADCDCGLDARPIRQIDRRYVAVCPADRRADVVLAADDLRSFRIDPPALVSEIATATGLGAAPSPIAPGIWYLGHTAAPQALFLALSRHAVDQAGTIAVMRSLAPSLPIILIAPELAADERIRLIEAGVSLATIGDCMGADGEGAVFAIDPAKLPRLPSFEARLIILRGSQRVIIDGVELDIPQQPFNLLVKLAEAAQGRKGYLTPQQIEAENSGRSAADLVRDLRKVLAAGRHDRPDELIKTRRNPTGYFLALSADRIELRP